MHFSFESDKKTNIKVKVLRNKMSSGEVFTFAYLLP